MTFNRTQAIACAKTIQALYAHDVPPTIDCAATDTQVRVEEIAPGHYAILFPGTASMRDWRTDAKIHKTAWSTGKVHRGFLNAWLSVSQQIVDAIPQGARVLIAGHSLGGALATLCAASLDYHFEIEAVYTFGSPRVGNGPFARHYNSLLSEITFRVVNAGDPIPQVPWVLGTYRHVDQLIYLNRAGGVDTNFVVAAAREIPVRLGEGDAERSQFVEVTAHQLTRYLCKLEALKA